MLESKANELDSIKDGLKDIKIAFINLQRVSNISKINNITFTEQIRVNLPPVEEKYYADDKLSEKIVIIGNSLIKEVNSRDGLAKIVSVSGAGIQELEKELQGVLPENLIVHTDANDIVGHMNRSEELMNKIKKRY